MANTGEDRLKKRQTKTYLSYTKNFNNVSKTDIFYAEKKAVGNKSIDISSTASFPNIKSAEKLIEQQCDEYEKIHPEAKNKRESKLAELNKPKELVREDLRRNGEINKEKGINKNNLPKKNTKI